MAPHLCSMAARQQEGELQRKGYPSHNDCSLASPWEFEVRHRLPIIRMCIQKASYCKSGCIIVKAREDHGHIDEGNLPIWCRAKPELYRPPQQCT